MPDFEPQMRSGNAVSGDMKKSPLPEPGFTRLDSGESAKGGLVELFARTLFRSDPDFAENFVTAFLRQAFEKKQEAGAPPGMPPGMMPPGMPPGMMPLGMPPGGPPSMGPPGMPPQGPPGMPPGGLPPVMG